MRLAQHLIQDLDDEAPDGKKIICDFDDFGDEAGTSQLNILPGKVLKNIAFGRILEINRLHRSPISV